MSHLVGRLGGDSGLPVRPTAPAWCWGLPRSLCGGREGGRMSAAAACALRARRYRGNGLAPSTGRPEAVGTFPQRPVGLPAGGHCAGTGREQSEVEVPPAAAGTWELTCRRPVDQGLRPLFHTPHMSHLVTGGRGCSPQSLPGFLGSPSWTPRLARLRVSPRPLSGV